MVERDDTKALLHELIELLREFERLDPSVDIRKKVLALLPAFDDMRDLGKSLIPSGLSLSARDRLLAYFKAYPLTILAERELALVAGISEWARRVRELRVELGWRIFTGVTAKEMLAENEILEQEIELTELGARDYVLLEAVPDREAAYRWNLANDIRKQKGGGRSKLLRFLKSNLGQPVSGEELRYVAQSSEWARRIRELRTEEGWPITTKMSGNPTLPIGVYVLEMDRQVPPHDRHIPESERRSALRRDDYTCQRCGWDHSLSNPSDMRFLELHHLEHHVKGGANVADNLKTLCNICHDEVHRHD